MGQMHQVREDRISSLNRFRILSPTSGSWQAGVLIAIAASLVIFILPLYVPVKPILAVSASYLAGFNNSVAIYGAAGLSALVFLITLILRERGPDAYLGDDYARLTGRFVASVVGASASVLALLSWIVAASQNRYLGDAGYIIEQATVRRDTGRALYTQLEFAYGPLLLLPEVWLSRLLHCSMTTAYYITFVIESSLGLLMLAWILNELPIRTSLKQAGLAILAFGAITPHLGLNYTFFRMISPLAVLLFATRGRVLWRCLLLLTAGEILELLISPELGLAMSIGVLTFGFLRAWQEGWRWLATAIVPVGVLATLLLTFGRPYLVMAATFSSGGLSLPVGPYPHILILVAALVWLVPVGLARIVGLRDPGSARLLAFYAASLALMPAALGRCDPLHVLFDGIGILVLSLIEVSRTSRRVRLGWAACLLVLALWNHYVNLGVFEVRSAAVLRQTVMRPLPRLLRKPVARILSHGKPYVRGLLLAPAKAEYHLDTSILNGIVGSAPVVTPIDISPAVEDDLKQSHHYSPTYYAFWVDMMNPTGEHRSIEDTNRFQWMLLPSDFEGGGQQLPRDLWYFQGVQIPYRQRKPILYYPGTAFVQNLKDRWAAVQTFGPYTLYRQKDLQQPEPGSSSAL